MIQFVKKMEKLSTYNEKNENLYGASLVPYQWGFHCILWSRDMEVEIVTKGDILDAFEMYCWGAFLGPRKARMSLFSKTWQFQRDFKQYIVRIFFPIFSLFARKNVKNLEEPVLTGTLDERRVRRSFLTRWSDKIEKPGTGLEEVVDDTCSRKIFKSNNDTFIFAKSVPIQYTNVHIYLLIKLMPRSHRRHLQDRKDKVAIEYVWRFFLTHLNICTRLYHDTKQTQVGQKSICIKWHADKFNVWRYGEREIDEYIDWHKYNSKRKNVLAYIL